MLYRKFKDCIEFAIKFKKGFPLNDKEIRKWWAKYVGSSTINGELVKETVEEALSEWVNSASYRHVRRNYAVIVWEDWEDSGDELMIEIIEGKIFVNEMPNRAFFLKEFVKYLTEIGILPQSVLEP